MKSYEAQTLSNGCKVRDKDFLEPELYSKICGLKKKKHPTGFIWRRFYVARNLKRRIKVIKLHLRAAFLISRENMRSLGCSPALITVCLMVIWSYRKVDLRPVLAPVTITTLPVWLDPWQPFTIGCAVVLSYKWDPWPLFLFSSETRKGKRNPLRTLDSLNVHAICINDHCKNCCKIGSDST